MKLIWSLVVIFIFLMMFIVYGLIKEGNIITACAVFVLSIGFGIWGGLSQKPFREEVKPKKRPA